jgi:Tfp pilus assembly protein PilN
MKDCDFIPPAYHEGRKLQAAVKVRASCIGALVAIMVLWAVAHHHRLQSAMAMLPEVDRQQEQVSIHLSKKAVMEAEQANLRNHQRLLGQLEEQVSVALLLSDISRRIPDTVVLTEVSAECPSLERFANEEEPPRPPESTPPEAKSANTPPPSGPVKPRDDRFKQAHLSMIGIAVDTADVVKFAAALEGSPLFDRIQMEVKGPTVWGGRRAQRFELTCEIVEQLGGRP